MINFKNAMIPRFWPVWWETSNGKYEDGYHRGKVLHAEEYTGRYTDIFNAVLRIEAPNTVRGWMEMSVELEQENLL